MHYCMAANLKKLSLVADTRAIPKWTHLMSVWLIQLDASNCAKKIVWQK